MNIWSLEGPKHFVKFSWCTPSLQVDAHAEECFFDKVKTGTKMGLMFEVAEGGFLDIDVTIEGPDGKIVHQVQPLSCDD